MEKSSEENHVLLVTFSAQGHINPMLRLAKRLANKGLLVTLATTEVVRSRILESTSTPGAADLINGVEVVFFSDGLSLDYDRKANLDNYMETLAKFGTINLSSLIKERYGDSRKKLRCLITNPFVPWVADVATELCIPCAMLWIQPCALYAVYYRFFNKLNSFPTLTDPDIVVELPGLPLLQTEDLPSFVLPTNPFGSFPKLFSQVFQSMDKYKWVLGNSFYELEKDVIDSMSALCPVRPVGPLVPPTLIGQDQELDASVDMWKSDDSCIEWLNQQPPCSVVYISFGSIVVLPAKQMESIATALKHSKRPFLWVVKPPEFLTPDGAGQLPAGFEEETKDQGQVVKWCPQTRVLSHPALACFITHCGWNSMLETICSGIPLIGYPQWTDQPTNAKLIVDVFNIGVRIKKEVDGTINSEEIEKCIEEIMVGPRAEELRQNATALKEAARQAVVAGGSSDENIRLFVDEIVADNILENGIGPSSRVENSSSSEGQDKVSNGARRE